MNEHTRAYYQSVWGFDPVRYRQVLGSTHFRYEEGFPLDYDPLLDRADVTIWARVDVWRETIQNRVVFQHAGREAEVACIHTAVYAAAPDELARLDEAGLVDRALSTEQVPVRLVPEEHFVALRSYVAGIADIGLGRCLETRYLPDSGRRVESLPFGFNHLMKYQVLHALVRLATCPGVMEFVGAYVGFVQGAGDWRLRQMIAQHPCTPAPVLHALAGDARVEVRASVSAHPHATPADLTRLARGGWEERLAVAGNPAAPREVLEHLANQAGTGTLRLAVAGNPGASEALLARLATDPDPHTRLAVAGNPAVTEELLVRLASDPAELVRAVTRHRLGHDKPAGSR